jgi:hypothetical protein
MSNLLQTVVPAAVTFLVGYQGALTRTSRLRKSIRADTAKRSLARRKPGVQIPSPPPHSRQQTGSNRERHAGTSLIGGYGDGHGLPPVQQSVADDILKGA